MQPIYLDNAASTRISDEVLAAMTEVMRTAWGNPSALHPQGAAARAHIETARGRLLAAMGDRGSGDIVWTSGCTEADTLAVLGAARVREGSIVLTTIEHPAVSSAAKRLAGDGRGIVQVPPDASGVIDPELFAAAASSAAVAAIVMVQNELGVVQPVAQIVAAIKRRAPGCHIHVDAAQAFGKIPLDVEALGAHSVAIAGHKLHGPKGVGALWLRKGTPLEPLWVGGGQQGGLRGGTQDAPGAAGLGVAAERAVAQLATARARWLELAQVVLARLAERGANVRQLVPDQRRAPHILALGVPGVPASALRTVMSSRGVYLSTGSSCASAASGPASGSSGPDTVGSSSKPDPVASASGSSGPDTVGSSSKPDPVASASGPASGPDTVGSSKPNPLGSASGSSGPDTVGSSKPGSGPDTVGSSKPGSGTVGSTKPSPILEAIGLPPDHGMVRLSFALDTTVAEVTTASDLLADVIAELRR